MSVFHQMGHHSENLLFEARLNAYRGAILSPVNYSQDDTLAQVSSIREELDDFEIIFDPQLYCPKTERPTLRDWNYYPKDVDTADTGTLSWWKTLVDNILASCQTFNPDHLCSPAIIPRTYSNGYYELMVQVADYCREQSSYNISLTSIVSLNDLASPSRPLEIASILSRTTANCIYLVLVSNTEPRRELGDPEELKGAMRLIRALSQAGMRVLVGFCAADIILWNFAGATDFATGKYFNLRRFTVTRFDEPSGGGGQLPYWFEESLMGLLRESDLLRIRNERMLSDASMSNPFSSVIFEQLDSTPPKPWLRYAWRHYLYWFADFHSRFQSNAIDPKALLREAENNWLALEDKGILMEEQRNNGQWLRAWRRAINEAFPQT